MNVEQILSGDLRAVARAATVIENGGGQGLLKQVFPHTGKATIIGITGAPGAGKSTLVDQLALAYRRQGVRVGILAVDPTSPYTGGAILGDRIRMQRHYGDADVFIRSMATRGSMGGIARATVDLALLLDAAGFGVVLVESVGVGQDEVEIARLADVTVVVLVPGMGDDVQAIKAGLMEIADVFVINKSDQPGADRLEREIKAEGAHVPVIRTVATEAQGIDEILATICSIEQRSVQHNRAVATWSLRLRQMLRERILDHLTTFDFEAAARQVASREKDPYSIIDNWVASVTHASK